MTVITLGLNFNATNLGEKEAKMFGGKGRPGACCEAEFAGPMEGGHVQGSSNTHWPPWGLGTPGKH